MTNNVNGDTYTEDKLFPDDKEAGDEVEIVMDGLQPANVYRFYVKYLTDVGTSPPSLDTLSFPLSPTSKPQSLAVEEVTSDHVKVSWQPPAVMAEGLSTDDLQYKLVTTGKHIEGITKSILQI